MTLQRLSIPGAALLNAEVQSGPVLRGLVVGSALLRRGQLRRRGGRGHVAPSHETLQARYFEFKFDMFKSSDFYRYNAEYSKTKTYFKLRCYKNKLS